MEYHIVLIDGHPYRSIWLDPGNPLEVCIIDQRALPWRLSIQRLRSSNDAYEAIANMTVRGAPLIGATAAWGLYLAALAQPDNPDHLKKAADYLSSARPTAINLRWSVTKLMSELDMTGDLAEQTRAIAETLCNEDVTVCRAIGEHGVTLIRQLSEPDSPGTPVNVLTHCNAGWLATVDRGTATAPIYAAHEQGMQVHVWVDETRPRNQGASLTAWELHHQNIPHTVIVDNAGGLLMQRGDVDLVIVGTDRTTAGGDVVNKIGTYLKALAAYHNNIPFYVALPTSSIDWTIDRGRDVPIEDRDAIEVTHIQGLDASGSVRHVRVAHDSPILNPGFDVTPVGLVTGFITELGVVTPDEFPSLQQRLGL